MTDYKLIEAVARGIYGGAYDAVAPNPECLREMHRTAQAAIAAMREQMVVKAWMYSTHDDNFVDAFRDPAPEQLVSAGWTETPLYACKEEGQ